jgi:DNA-directed RNA polymerase subunit RPC12/RpoP
LGKEEKEERKYVHKIEMGQNDEDLEEKKLLGSGGYAIAKLTENEEMKANLGVPHLFLANVGRLAEDRFLRYYCNRCGKEYNGKPLLIYEVPNEEIAENVILVEKGEYKCRNCNNTIAQYCKFSK